MPVNGQWRWVVRWWRRWLVKLWRIWIIRSCWWEQCYMPWHCCQNLRLKPCQKQILGTFTYWLKKTQTAPSTCTGQNFRYKVRSVNKLQKGAISLILEIGKIQNIGFVWNLILNICGNFFNDDVITVTSSLNRTQSICVLFSPTVIYYNSQVTNSIETKKIILTS